MEEQRQLPVNVRQVGSADGIYTVYVEDYVETFIRKQRYTEKRPVISGYLYGRKMLFDEEMKCLIYGAIADTKTTKERGKDKGKKFFPEYEMVGWFAKGQRDKLFSAEEQNQITAKLGLAEGSVCYIGDGENCAMLAMRGESLYPLSGHMIFYERNEAMQEYMIQAGDGKSIESEIVDTAAVQFREIMQKKAPQDILSGRVEQEVQYGGTAQDVSSERVTQEVQSAKLYKKSNRGVTKFAAVFAVVLLGGSLVFSGNDSLRKDAFSWVQQWMEKEKEQDIAVNVVDGNVKPTETPEDETPAQTEESAGESTEAADTPPIETPAETQPQTPAETQPQTPPETAPSQPAETPAQTNPAPSEPVYVSVDHVVSAGETLNGILKSYYGNESRLAEICEINQIENPDEIFEGQIIHLPQ